MNGMGFVEYHSNNSGGQWWLADESWKALEAAGWIVHWNHDPDDPSHEHSEPVDRRWLSLRGHNHGHTDPLLPAESDGSRRLGALATSAAKATDDPSAAVAEWERATGHSAAAEGCNCCGNPRRFEFTDAEGNRRSTHVEVTATTLRWSS